jgi:hypothetical protein
MLQSCRGVEELLCRQDEIAALVGQRHGPGAAMDQTGTELLLERANLAGDCAVQASMVRARTTVDMAATGELASKWAVARDG